MDAVIVNRLLPEEVGSYLERWREVQEENLRTIEESFKGLPIMKVPMLRDELIGQVRLKEVASILYGKRDPAEIFVKERPFQVVRGAEDGRVTLRLKAPFLQKEDIQLLNRGGILVIEASNWRRIFTLPETLIDYEPIGAAFDEGCLSIFLEEPQGQS